MTVRTLGPVRCGWIFGAAALWLAAVPLQAQGIPEPSLVLFGVVSNAAAGNARVSFGTLNWVFKPADGSPAITLIGTLTNINDQFSYVLRIPCETEIPGVSVSPSVLKLSPTPARYDRSQVTIDGVAAGFVDAGQTTLVLAPTDRGRIERVDLTLNLNTGGALPSAWQIQYFGHTGVDPNADPDHDGMSNLQEYLAGTDPTDPQSQFAILNVSSSVAGGPVIEWSSVSGKFYTVQRSGDLLSGFADIQTHISATAPQNSFQDTSAGNGGLYFYRLRVEPQ